MTVQARPAAARATSSRRATPGPAGAPGADGWRRGFRQQQCGKSAGGGGGSGGGPQTSGSDDDIVARRLRKAAEEETDPELKERLWKEYNDYKKSAK